MAGLRVPTLVPDLHPAKRHVLLLPIQRVLQQGLHGRDRQAEKEGRRRRRRQCRTDNKRKGRYQRQDPRQRSRAHQWQDQGRLSWPSDNVNNA